MHIALEIQFLSDSMLIPTAYWDSFCTGHFNCIWSGKGYRGDFSWLLLVFVLKSLNWFFISGAWSLSEVILLALISLRQEEGYYFILRCMFQHMTLDISPCAHPHKLSGPVVIYTALVSPGKLGSAYGHWGRRMEGAELCPAVKQHLFTYKVGE